MATMLREIFNNLDLTCDKWSHYFDLYETHFAKYVNKSPVVIEVGIYRGGSAEMWKKYFGTGATIIGVDIDENVTKYTTDGCVQFLGDQGDPALWDKILATYPEIDVFLDDGSHLCQHQISTLKRVWPHIKLGGTYMCEDTHTNYWPNYGGSLKNPHTFLEYAKQISDTMNVEYFQGNDRHPDNLLLADFYKEVIGMHFYDSVVVMDKNNKLIPERLWSKPL
jgi:cephalosporin hydroxylase